MASCILIGNISWHYFIWDDYNNERTYSAAEVQTILMDRDYLAGDVQTCKEAINRAIKDWEHGLHTLDSVMDILLNLQDVLQCAEPSN